MPARATGNMLYLPSGRSVRFDQPILEVVEIRGTTIVVLDQPSGRDVSENVFAVDSDGRVVWRIARHEFPQGPDYYVGVSDAGSVARLIHFSGFVLDVDPRTGRVVSQRFGK